MTKVQTYPDMTVAELTALYNTQAARPIKKFDSKQAAFARIDQLCYEKGLRITPEKKLAPVAKTTGPKGGKRGGKGKMGARKYSDAHVVRVLRTVPEKRVTGRNPATEYRDGRTIAALLATGNVTRRDLNWDAREDRPGGPVIEILAPKESAS